MATPTQSSLSKANEFRILGDTEDGCSELVQCSVAGGIYPR